MKPYNEAADALRRSLVTAGVASLIARPALALAQSDIVQLTVGFPPGGPSDIVARLLLDAGLGEAYGRRFIVDNRPGGGGMIAARRVARAAPDGHSFLMTPSFLLSNALVYAQPGYDPLKDFTPVGAIGSSYLVLAVHADAPFQGFADLAAHAREKGPEVSFVSPGAGSHHHLAGEGLNRSIGVRMTHVPYKGEAAALQDVLGRQATCGFFAIGLVQQHVGAGRLRLLAVAALQRMPEVPNVPTLREAGADHPLFDIVSWFGVFAPARTPDAIVRRLAQALDAVLGKPAVAQRLAEFGIRPWRLAPEEFAGLLVRDLALWKKGIEATDVRLAL
ncbi:Bug family tripartite tricarboxylate transporter substrate binding protein [Variovorax paradoxus]|uniref:Bug family tripartite tricarboxylate transporter substrate binding protein n=1 Tax=Variovorax paradoxus TaxID=34073 RepID=UPI0005AC5FCD|nr:tripartite tricarboxylate transporter substrate binding protein [Variovorax paradoxus]